MYAEPSERDAPGEGMGLNATLDVAVGETAGVTEAQVEKRVEYDACSVKTDAVGDANSERDGKPVTTVREGELESDGVLRVEKEARTVLVAKGVTDVEKEARPVMIVAEGEPEKELVRMEEKDARPVMMVAEGEMEDESVARPVMTVPVELALCVGETEELFVVMAVMTVPDAVTLIVDETVGLADVVGDMVTRAEAREVTDVDGNLEHVGRGDAAHVEGKEMAVTAMRPSIAGAVRAHPGVPDVGAIPLAQLEMEQSSAQKLLPPPPPPPQEFSFKLSIPPPPPP